MTAPFVEQDCTIEHEGRKFTSGGNQHTGRRAGLLALLGVARAALADGEVEAARSCLLFYRMGHAQAPASTRRRWKCGR